MNTLILIGVGLLNLATGVTGGSAHEDRVPVVFSGGHDTDPVDRGRPVILIAGALGVPPKVFREAFSHVSPAPAGSEPEPGQVRRNKEALLSALGKYGITNERLDEVSDHYRYAPGRGNIWPTKAARAYAILDHGSIKKIVLTEGGEGYTSPPTVAVSGKPLNAKIEIGYGKDFSKNGALKSVVAKKGS